MDTMKCSTMRSITLLVFLVLLTSSDAQAQLKRDRIVAFSDSVSELNYVPFGRPQQPPVWAYLGELGVSSVSVPQVDIGRFSPNLSLRYIVADSSLAIGQSTETSCCGTHWVGHQLNGISRLERQFHTALRNEKWVLPVAVGTMTASQILYVSAYYNKEDGSAFIHPAQTFFDSSFQVAAYIMVDNFWDYKAVSMIQNVLLQVAIELGSGHSAFGPEGTSYDLFGVWIPKPWANRRPYQLGTAIGILVGRRLLKRLLK